MSLVEIIRQARNAAELKDGWSRAKYTSSLNQRGLELPADLRRFTDNNESYGLKRPEVHALFLALGELTGNIEAGLGVKAEVGITIGESETDRRIDAAFSQAGRTHEQPEATFGIIFNTKTGGGEVYTTHPVVSGFSPESFDITQAKKGRREERRGINIGIGGLENIESGYIHDRLADAGISHTEIKTIDTEVVPGEKVRKVWFKFQRKS